MVSGGATLGEKEQNEQFSGFVSQVEEDIAASELARANRSVAQRWESWRGSGISLVVKLVDVQERNTKLLRFLRSENIGGKLWSEAAFDAFFVNSAQCKVIEFATFQLGDFEALGRAGGPGRVQNHDRARSYEVACSYELL